MEIETKEETKTFIEYLDDKAHLPNPAIITALDENRFAFSKNLFFKYNPSYLGADEFNRCVQIFKDRTPRAGMHDLSHVIALMISREDVVREQLEALCVKSIKDMYNVPDQISLEAKIAWVHQENEGGDDEPEEEDIDPDRLSMLREEIEKRRILNTIVHGGAIHQWTSAFYIIQEELDVIDQGLLNLYKQYSSIINYYNWMHSMATDAKEMNLKGEIKMKDGEVQTTMVQGFNIVDYENKSIYAQGMCLPVAIHEMSKGVLDYLIGIGIPNHLPKHELRYVFKKANAYHEEFWHYYLGPTLFRAILTTSDVESQKLPKIISTMAKMKYSELAELCVNIVFHPDTVGKKEMAKIKRISGIKS